MQPRLRGMRWVKDPETGERTRKEVPLRLRRWWWKDEKGVLVDAECSKLRDGCNPQPSARTSMISN
jgi:hypothetical protein